MIIRSALALITCATLTGCGGGKPLSFNDPDAVFTNFSGEQAFAHVAALTEKGPRPAGSETLEKARVYCESQVETFGWSYARQTFTTKTPIGDIEFSNIRARFGDDWEKPVQIVIGSHIDTKTYSDDTLFVGANDSGSSTGVLIEMARTLAERPELAERIELVFFDGEEAFNRFNETDGLFGSREYAKMVRKWPVKPDYGIVLDMIGDKDLKIRVPSDTPKHLLKSLFSAAEDLGVRNKFGRWNSSIIDDHVPLNNINVPTIDIIDFDYKYWHTPGDTLDKISADSLQIVGQTTLLMIEKYLVTVEAHEVEQ